MSNNDYIKYQHVEKLGSDEVDGILMGTVYVFPKIDGTNAHIWMDDDGQMHYGSRTRELSLEKDNAGFMEWASQKPNLTALCAHLGPGHHVFGEWLVPHSLKTYREDAWRDFYVFDITFESEEGIRHLQYDDVQRVCEGYEVNYIPPMRVIKNPTDENIMRVLDDNHYLIEDGKGTGEGVVLKNYAFVNRFGRQTWAKVVTSEFKEKHHKAMGAPISSGTDYIEEKIVEKYCTTALIEKTHAKIVVARDGWNSKCIPQLLSTVFHDLVVEHSWDFVKDYKMPKVDYKVLNRFTIMKIKDTMPQLF